MDKAGEDNGAMQRRQLRHVGVLSLMGWAFFLTLVVNCVITTLAYLTEDHALRFWREELTSVLLWPLGAALGHGVLALLYNLYAKWWGGITYWVRHVPEPKRRPRTPGLFATVGGSGSPPRGPVTTRQEWFYEVPEGDAVGPVELQAMGVLIADRIVVRGTLITLCVRDSDSGATIREETLAAERFPELDPFFFTST